MKMKYLGIILVFFLMLSVAGAIDFNDVTDDDLKNIKFSDNDTKISVHNHDFTIPKGYGIIDKLNVTETGEDGITNDYRFFENGNENVIMVCVMSGNVSLDLDTYNFTKNPTNITIGDHDGILFENNGYYFFEYVDGDCVVILQAIYPNTFEKMVR